MAELRRLFDTAKRIDEFEFVNVLKGYNGMGDQRALTHLYESRAYLQDMKAQLIAATTKHTKTRLGLHMYCHMFEMDELYNMLGNLFRIAVGHGLRYIPDLYNNYGELLTPTDKIERLKVLSEQSRFEEFVEGLNSLYSNKIRNAFLHSAYSLIENDFCIVKGDGIVIGQGRHKSVSINQYLMPLIESTIHLAETLFGLIDDSKMAYRKNVITKARMSELQSVVILGDPEKGLIGFQTFVGSWIKIKSGYGSDHFVEAMNLVWRVGGGPHRELGDRLSLYIEKKTPYGKDFNAIKEEVLATKDPSLMHNLAIVYYKWANNTAITARGKPERQQDAIYRSAFERYELAEQVDPSFARIYHNKGTMLLKQAGSKNAVDNKLRQEALALFEKTLSLDKNMYEAWLNSARVISEFGNGEADASRQLELFQESISRYHTAIGIYPHDADPHENLGWLYRRLAYLG